MNAIKFLTKNCGFSCGDPDSEISRAWAEIEAMAADAERYRWLRNDGDRSNSSYIARPLGVYGLGPRLYTHDALDAEIEHSRTVQRSCTIGTAMNGANKK